MNLDIIAVVLFAALLHATCNLFVKRSTDTFQAMVSVVLGRGLLGAGALFYSPEISIELVFFIVVGVFLHLGYQILLLNSYRLADLTQVYPLARGSSPLIIALISIFFRCTLYAASNIGTCIDRDWSHGHIHYQFS